MTILFRDLLTFRSLIKCERKTFKTLCIILCSRSRNVILWAIIIEIRKCNFLQEDRCLLDLHYSPFPNKRAAEHIKKIIPCKVRVFSEDHKN